MGAGMATVFFRTAHWRSGSAFSELVPLTCAGAMKEQEGDYLGAIALYLEGGLPVRAAKVPAN